MEEKLGEEKVLIKFFSPKQFFIRFYAHFEVPPIWRVLNKHPNKVKETY